MFLKRFCLHLWLRVRSKCIYKERRSLTQAAALRFCVDSWVGVCPCWSVQESAKSCSVCLACMIYCSLLSELLALHGETTRGLPSSSLLGVSLGDFHISDGQYFSYLDLTGTLPPLSFFQLCSLLTLNIFSCYPTWRRFALVSQLSIIWIGKIDPSREPRAIKTIRGGGANAINLRANEKRGLCFFAFCECQCAVAAGPSACFFGSGNPRLLL